MPGGRLRHRGGALLHGGRRRWDLWHLPTRTEPRLSATEHGRRRRRFARCWEVWIDETSHTGVSIRDVFCFLRFFFSEFIYAVFAELGMGHFFQPPGIGQVVGHCFQQKPGCHFGYLILTHSQFMDLIIFCLLPFAD